ncbi:molybdate ABC transporter substrate-binding protein [Rothia mucilaginosa]|uniref:molybdate ABC transporter substrate-binding protein n=1 Tax=Rothia mucilaginosa TaxID=43675 RepID=UPI00066B1F30|nr:molybdate ABC transporter substrate-binding protein [Rothia mucilaginosa]
MKSPLAALSALAAATLALTGCGATQNSSSSTASASSRQAASGKVEVFAAASLNNAGADLEKAYEAANPGVDVTFVYEGSAKLVNQIEQGATPDLLITADTKNMDKAKKLDQFSGSETNVLVTNKLVLVTAEGNPGKINSLDDLKTTDGVVAVCKEDVPCGTIAHQELKKHDITLKNATTESKVTDVATKVTTGNADAGFIYTTDLAAAKKKGVNLGSVELTDVERNEYPAALSKTGSSSETAKKFNEWLKNSDEAKKILTEYGFNTAK